MVENNKKIPVEYPFTPGTVTIDGRYRMSYVDEGNGHAVVFLHGNPSWSYLYRNLITGLKKHHRCIAPDHIGCGYSDKPQDYPYLLENHIDNLEYLLDTLHIDKCSLVVHDWGGAIGMGWAVRHPQRVEKIVVMNTAAFRSTRIPFRINICRIPFLGPLMVRGLNGFARGAVHMAVRRKMSPGVAKGFVQPYDSWGNRIATLRFIQDIPMHPEHPSWNTLLEVEQGLEALKNTPMLICWGGKDFCFTKHFYEEWQQRFPQAACHYFANAGHYLLEDALDEVYPLVQDFLNFADVK